MKRALLPASLVFAALCACKSAPTPFSDAPGPTEPSVRLRFSPPEGEALRERMVNARIETSPSGEAKESVTIVMNSRFDRAGEGWTLTQTVPEVEISVNGQRIESDLAQLVTKFPVQLRLAGDGTFVRLLNDQQIGEAIRAAFPDERAERMVAAFSPEAIEEQSRREWNEKYGELLGRELTKGTAWYTVQSLGTTQGEVWFVVEHAFAGTRQGPLGQEVVITHTCPSAPDKALKPDAMQAELEARGNPPLDATVQCAGQQVLAVEPFVPLSNTLDVRAKVQDDAGRPVDVAFNREVRREAVPASADAGTP